MSGRAKLYNLMSFLTEALKEEEEEEASSFPAGCYEGKKDYWKFGSFPSSQFTGYLISQKQTLWSVCSYYV
jgi:hypothetical protein